MPTIIKKDRVEVRELSAAERAQRVRPTSGGSGCEKAVELLEEQGQVVAIQVTCSCGDRTVVALEYAQPQNGATS